MGTRSPVIVVEVVVLSVGEGCLRYRMLRRPLSRGAHPDAVARALAAGEAQEALALLHSTSWRYEDGAMVVTYAVLPDPRPDGATPLTPTGIATSTDPLRPSPPRVSTAQVATHACRHLAYLAGVDRTVAGALAGHPALWTLVTRFAPTTAGLLGQPAPA